MMVTNLMRVGYKY